MIITRWRWYWLTLLAFIIYLVVLTVGRLCFQLDVGNWYWVIFGTLLLLLWRNSPPYKSYIFSMEHLRGGDEPLRVLVSHGTIYEIQLTDVDSEKGARFTIFEVSGYSGGTENRRTSRIVGSWYLLPSGFDAALQRASGNLQILCIKNGQVTIESYLEKVTYGATGIMLHFVAKDDSGCWVMVEVVKKKPSMWDMLRKRI